MLAVVGVNIGPVSKAPLIVLVKVVITSHHLDNSPQSGQLIRCQAFDVLTDFGLAGLGAVLIDRSCRERMFFMPLGQRHLERLTYFDACFVHFIGRRTAVINPTFDKENV